MATLRRLYKSGNSVVVSLPEHYLDWLSLKIGDQVIISTGKSANNCPYLKLRSGIPVRSPKPSNN
jgi:hypothetical protein